MPTHLQAGAPLVANGSAPALPAWRRTDRLDQPIRVLSPQLFVGLAALAVALAAAIAWGLFGSVPQRVTATGVLSGRSGLQLLQARQAGSVTAVLVPTGSRVVTGEQLVVLSTTSGRRVLRAPVAGTVVVTLAVPGEQVVPGTPLESIEPGGPVDRALLFVSPSQVSGVHPGDEVVIGLGGVLVGGTVRTVDPDPLSDVDLVDRFGTGHAPGLPAASHACEVVVGLHTGRSGPRLPPFAEIRGSVLVGSRPPYKTVLG